jgi:hypothetical protein
VSTECPPVHQRPTPGAVNAPFLRLPASSPLGRGHRSMQTPRSCPHLALLDEGVHIAPHGATPGQGSPPSVQDGLQDDLHLLDLLQDGPVQLKCRPQPGEGVEQLGRG